MIIQFGNSLKMQLPKEIAENLPAEDELKRIFNTV